MKRIPWLLIFGDAVTLAVVVAIGLRTHQQESLARLPLTWLPTLAAWLLAGWTVDAFAERMSFRQMLARVLLATLLASPLATVLRAAWLGATVIPLFVLVMGATSAAGLLIWRALYGWLLKRNG